MTRVATAIVLMMFVGGSASADIVEWRDGNGVTHYTNVKEEVPSEERDSVQVVVDEVVRHPVSLAKDPAAAAVPADPPREAEVIYDRSAVSEAYLDGLVRGLEAARANGMVGGSVQIYGPLAIASAPASIPYAYASPYAYVSPYDYLSPYPFGSPYYPVLVTTSVNRRRFGHHEHGPFARGLAHGFGHQGRFFGR